jgi:hypothetical protein
VFLQRQQRQLRPPVHARSSSSWTPDGLLAKDSGSEGFSNAQEPLKFDYAVSCLSP